jgi:hypothetical protein
MLYDISNLLIVVYSILLTFVSLKELSRKKKILLVSILIVLIIPGILGRLLTKDTNKGDITSNSNNAISTSLNNSSDNIIYQDATVNQYALNNINSDDFNIELYYDANLLLKEGESAKYLLKYPNDRDLSTVYLNKDYIVTHGFDADIEIIENTDSKNQYYILLNNIRLNKDYKDSAYIEIKDNSAKDVEGYKSSALVESQHFLIKDGESDVSGPGITVSPPTRNNVELGGAVEFTVTFINSRLIDFLPSDIGIAGNGVTCNKQVFKSNDNDYTYTVRLSNIQGKIGKVVSIAIRSGVGLNHAGYTNETPKSYGFKIQEPDTSKPGIMCESISSHEINEGDSITYIIRYYDPNGISKITLSEDDIDLHGFIADIEVVDNDETSKKVILKKIYVKENYKTNKHFYISIRIGTAYDLMDNPALSLTESNDFMINR